MKKYKKYKPQIRINEAIKTRELRILGVKGENIGIMDSRDALKKSARFRLRPY